MAQLNEIARKVLPVHLEKVYKMSSTQRWRIEHDTETGVTFVNMIGGQGVGKTDPYLLKLEFDYYPAQPPSALFVNPETKERGTVQEQRSFWPIFNKIPGTTKINITEDSRVGGLYLCYPYTYEFEITHSKPEHRWQPPGHTLLTTLITLQNALSGQAYGRYLSNV